jgi:hypothetical protein
MKLLNKVILSVSIQDKKKPNNTHIGGEYVNLQVSSTNLVFVNGLNKEKVL